MYLAGPEPLKEEDRAPKGLKKTPCILKSILGTFPYPVTKISANIYHGNSAPGKGKPISSKEPNPVFPLGKNASILANLELTASLKKRLPQIMKTNYV